MLLLVTRELADDRLAHDELREPGGAEQPRLDAQCRAAPSRGKHPEQQGGRDHAERDPYPLQTRVQVGAHDAPHRPAQAADERPGAGDHDAEQVHDNHHRFGRPGPGAQAVPAAGGIQADNRVRDQAERRHRGPDVQQAEHQWQAEQHDHHPEHGGGDREDQRGQREPAQPPIGESAPLPGSEREEDQRAEGDHPVGDLDCRVQAVRRDRRAVAAGPARARESGLGGAHRRPQHHRADREAGGEPIRPVGGGPSSVVFRAVCDSALTGQSHHGRP